MANGIGSDTKLSPSDKNKLNYETNFRIKSYANDSELPLSCQMKC